MLLSPFVCLCFFYLLLLLPLLHEGFWDRGAFRGRKTHRGRATEGISAEWILLLGFCIALGAGGRSSGIFCHRFDSSTARTRPSGFSAVVSYCVSLAPCVDIFPRGHSFYTLSPLLPGSGTFTYIHTPVCLSVCLSVDSAWDSKERNIIMMSTRRGGRSGREEFFPPGVVSRAVP
jgi:hypothetical protein